MDTDQVVLGAYIVETDLLARCQMHPDLYTHVISFYCSIIFIAIIHVHQSSFPHLMVMCALKAVPPC